MLHFFKTWNWGKGIATAIVLLCSAILLVVYKATTYNYDMVTGNYYEEELHFNDNVRAAQNAQSLSRPVRISQEGGFILVEFPEECKGQQLEGSLQLYRASDAGKDLIIPIRFVTGTFVSIPETATIRGHYNFIARWTMNGKDYRVSKDFQVL